MNTTKCKHVECEIETSYLGYCKFHFKGGIFNTGQTYQQYELIEKDFIDFIKVIPLNEDYHLKVYSPILWDIIIRCCVQIEVFLKEWSKFLISENPSLKLFENYYKTTKNKLPKKARNWNFGDYFELFEAKYIKNRPVYVRYLNSYIYPFKDWTSSKPDGQPIWWSTYNAIKHDGYNNIKKANLENALNVLAALFNLHCQNRFSKEYLKQFSALELTKDKLSITGIKTPLDSKQYLFKDPYSSNFTVKLNKSTDYDDRANGRGRNV